MPVNDNRISPSTARVASTGTDAALAAAMPASHIVVLPMPASPWRSTAAGPEPSSEISRLRAASSRSRPMTPTGAILSAQRQATRALPEAELDQQGGDRRPHDG